MAEKLVTVKTSGGDYTTQAAAELGERGDLPTLDRQLVVECYPMEDTTLAYWNPANWTVDATRFITIRTPSTDRPDFVGWDTSVYRNKGSTNIAMRVDVDYTVIDGIQCEQASSSNLFAALRTGGDNMTIKNCMTRGTGTGTGLKGFQTVVADNLCLINCVALDFIADSTAQGFVLSTSSNGGMRVSNCGAHNCATGFIETFNAPIARNCWTQSCTNGWSGTYHADSDYNISDLAADAPGANSKQSTSIDFVDEANDDFHLAATDTAARRFALDLTNDATCAFNTDAVGNLRTASWDNGPLQVVTTEESGSSAEVGDIKYVGGGVTARGGAISAGTIKLEVYDENDSLVATLIGVTALVLADDAGKTFAEISPPNVSYTFTSAGLFFFRQTVVNDNSESFTDEEAIRVRTVLNAPSITDVSIDSDNGQMTITVDGGATDTITVSYATTDGKGADFGSRTGPGTIGPVSLERGRGYMFLVESDKDGLFSTFAWKESS